MGSNKILGAFGENKACEYLEECGYRVLERNFACRTGEIDIIALEGEIIAFIEVKTRSSERYGLPAEAISRNKQNKLVTAALYYMQRNGYQNRMCRFDVMEIIIDGEDNYRINLIKDAFQYSGRYGY
ncbi:MAG TPA: YraN family protein [Bacillota bacterium]|nr:YraN family protein [Clostridiaceae bacterium]HNR04830.1 YraN family protein [Bacillota bacterium]HNT03457.1 YraN family protein [Bacillota bacterium]HPA53588.1 YraN family protein [Bacillota bacterium]HPX68095.1 YraN family protein [Bacillota bacterium]